MSAVLSAVSSAASWLIGSTTGRIALGIVLFFLWLAHHDNVLTKRVQDQCQAKQLAVTITELQRQLKVNEDALATAATQDIVTDKELADLRKQKDDAVRNVPKGPCVVPPDRTRKLSNIR